MARGFQKEALVRIEDDLVSAAQHGVTHGLAIDDRGLARHEATQHHLPVLYLDACMALGKGRVIDADVAILAPADHPRAVQREATTVVSTADAAKQHARIRVLAGKPWNGASGVVGTAQAEQQQFRAIHIDRIADTQHRHVPHGPAIDVHAARLGCELQPDAAAIHAQLRQRLIGVAHRHQRATWSTANAVDTRGKLEVSLGLVRKSQAKVVHPGNLACAHAWMRLPATAQCNIHDAPSTQESTVSHIDIHHAHSLTHKQALKAVEDVAVKLRDRFGMNHRWENDVLHFSRSGVDGRIEVTPKDLHVTAKLGFLLAAMKGPIEQEIRRVLGEKF